MAESKSKSASTAKKDNASTEKKAVKKRNVPVTSAWSEEDVLQWDQEEGVTLFFDPNSFVELSSETVDQLSFYSAQSYFQAKNAWKERKAKEEAEKPVSFEDLKVGDPLSISGRSQLQLRERRGFHQTWKRPDEVEGAREVGYQFIRKNRKKDGATEENEPGKEKGEVIKIMDEKGEPELYAMEVPLDLYDQHLQSVSDRVKYRKGEQVERVKEAADVANTKLRDKDAVKIRDFSNDSDEGWREIE